MDGSVQKQRFGMGRIRPDLSNFPRGFASNPSAAHSRTASTNETARLLWGSVFVFASKRNLCLTFVGGRREAVSSVGMILASPQPDGGSRGPQEPTLRILIVDDQRAFRRVLRDIVAKLPNTEVVEAASLEEARRCERESRPDVMLVDIRLSDDELNRDGLAFVSDGPSAHRGRIICVTASSEMALIRQAMRAGAYDYILKDDLSEDLILPILREIEARLGLERELTTLRARAADDLPFAGLVGASPAMVSLREKIQRVALSDRPVLVTGPMGAGKEEVARAIHRAGPNPTAPFFDVNCGAFPVHLAESELFGHVKGAFTGATADRDGCFKAVRAGTLLLDEVAELSKDLQVKLLRVVETRQFRPTGSDKTPLPFLGRIVAATNDDLRARAREKRFREDLLYRLEVLTIDVPPLEARSSDIPMLVAHLVARQSRPLHFTDDAFAFLQAQSWPGNVRQLRTVVDRLAVFANDNVVRAADVSAVMNTADAVERDRLRQMADAVLDLSGDHDRVTAMEDALYSRALERAQGNNSHAGRLLGVSRKSVERWRRRTTLAQWRTSGSNGDGAGASADGDGDGERGEASR
jgi:DNA-binding NtrC family response regulator